MANKTKRLFIDLCYCDDYEKTRVMTKKEQKKYEAYIDKMFVCSMQALPFDKSDVRMDIQIIGDGGDYVVLKDGRFYNVCWRYNSCHVWEEDDKEQINYIKELIERWYNLRLIKGIS